MGKFKEHQVKIKLFQECFENEYGFYTQPISTSDSDKILFANAYGKTKEECLSRAKLIAADLEMLEMLQKILDINKYHAFNGHLINERIEELIKKITE